MRRPLSRPSAAPRRSSFSQHSQFPTRTTLTLGVILTISGGIQDKIKKRVALANRGKSAGARTLVAFKEGSHTFYLYGFKKNERSNTSDKELRALKSAAGVWFSLSQSDLDSAIEAGILIELECEE